MSVTDWTLEENSGPLGVAVIFVCIMSMLCTAANVVFATFVYKVCQEGSFIAKTVLSVIKVIIDESIDL